MPNHEPTMESMIEGAAEETGTATSAADGPVLEVRDLAISYRTRKQDVPAVRGVSFTVGRGQTVGLVGESGCGKSTVAFGLLNFLGSNGRVVGGSIQFQGKEMVGRPRAELRRIRGSQISMVYQDPMQALNPTLSIGRQLTEVLTTHQNVTEEEARERSIHMLQRVYMPDPDHVMNRYPHMLSGGQQQRVVIAMAMLNSPSLLIMDEPTTALDVTVEAAVLDLIEDLKQEFDTGILFITHNLGVVARVSDRLCVMYAGEMVEQGPAGKLFAQPSHPYTRALLCCVPRLTDDLSFSKLWSIRGRVPHPSNRNKHACIFAPRCDWKIARCDKEHPQLENLSDEHRCRCFVARETLKTPWNEYFRGKRRQIEAAMDDDQEDAATSEKTLLAARNVKIYYEQPASSLKGMLGMESKRRVRAVDDISLQVKKGQTIGMVGESGCGKSTLVKGVIGLEKLTGGSVELMGVDISQPVSKRDLGFIRELQMVFQNPDATLNPSFSVGKQIARPLKRFKTVARNQVDQEVIHLLRSVKLADYYYHRYPRQLSGGEKQRVGIARALASHPSLVICDEPVSALDVSVQAAVLNLLNDIKDEFGSTLVFIAHDLSVVRFISDVIAVIYLGKVVEFGPVERLYMPPYHPYSEALLSAVPVPDPTIRGRRIRLSGEVPSALNPPPGCTFHTRCPRRDLAPDGGRICEVEAPPWQACGAGHRISCHIPLDILRKMDPVLPTPL